MDSTPNFDWPLFNELHEIEVRESSEISVEAFLSLYETEISVSFEIPQEVYLSSQE